MAFKWFKKDTFSKLGDLVKQYGYPIALRNKLKDTFMPQQEDDKQTGLRQPITDEGFTITPPVGVDKTKSLEENVKGMQPLTVEEKPTIAPQTSNDVSGIKTILQTQQGAKEWNKKVQKDYLDFLNYATKFGEQGKPYMELAGLYAKGSMKDIPQLQNIDPKQVQRDSKTGMAYIMQLNPANGSLVKMDLGVPYEDIVPDYKEPFDPKRYNYFIGENGNAWKMDLKNPDKIEDVGVPYKNFEVLNGIQLEKLDMEKTLLPYQIAKLESQINKLNKPTGKGNSNSDSDGTGLNTKGGLILTDETGQPLDLLRLQDGNLETLIKGLSNSKEKIKSQSLDIIKKYYPQVRVVNEGIAKQMTDGVKQAIELVKSGQKTNDEFNAYLQQLRNFDPASYDYASKKFTGR